MGCSDILLIIVQIIAICADCVGFGAVVWILVGGAPWNFWIRKTCSCEFECVFVLTLLVLQFPVRCFSRTCDGLTLSLQFTVCWFVVVFVALNCPLFDSFVLLPVPNFHRNHCPQSRWHNYPACDKILG